MFYNYFLPVCGVFFVEQNVLVLMTSTNFFLMDHVLVVYLKIHSQIQGHLDFCYFLSVLCFTFRSVIHFDFLWKI